MTGFGDIKSSWIVWCFAGSIFAMGGASYVTMDTADTAHAAGVDNKEAIVNLEKKDIRNDAVNARQDATNVRQDEDIRELKAAIVRIENGTIEIKKSIETSIKQDLYEAEQIKRLVELAEKQYAENQ